MRLPEHIMDYLEVLVMSQRDFQATVERPSPSTGTGNEIADLCAVIARTKPAAIILTPIVLENSQLFNWLIQLAENEGLAVKESFDLTNRTLTVVGIEPNVSRIAEATKNGNQTRVTREYHEILGRSLGYPEEAIRQFLARDIQFREQREMRRFGFY